MGHHRKDRGTWQTIQWHEVTVMENDRAGRGGVGDEVSSKSRWSGNHQHPTAPPTISMTWQARAIRDSFVLIIVAHKIIILEGGWLFAKSWTYLGKGFKCISFSYIHLFTFTYI